MIIGIIILLPSLAMMILRPHYIRQQQELDAFPYSYRDISNFLVEASYVPVSYTHLDVYKRQGDDATQTDAISQKIRLRRYMRQDYIAR